MNIKHTAIIATMISIGLFADAETNRSDSWAIPIPIDGVPNLHKVSDVLYRSAQPTPAGMKEVEKLGVKTVLNLRSFHSDSDEIEGTSLTHQHLYVKAWHPERKEVVRFLQIVTDSKQTPVLVHCQHGADRTGTMCAIYRIVVQKWTKEEALREMTEGGFGFHEVWQNLPKWIDELDVATLGKEAAGERNTEPAGGAHVSPAAGETSAHP